jgi:DNA-binding IclR family transcriptional regulator
MTPSGKAAAALELLRAAPDGLTPEELAAGLGVALADVAHVLATLSTSTPLLAYGGRWSVLEGLPEATPARDD